MAQKYSQPYCLVKYMDLYIAVCCNIAYGTAAPSCGLLVYEHFSTVLKPLMTKVAEIPARWQCPFTLLPSNGFLSEKWLKLMSQYPGSVVPLAMFHVFFFFPLKGFFYIPLQKTSRGQEICFNHFRFFSVFSNFAKLNFPLNSICSPQPHSDTHRL